MIKGLHHIGVATPDLERLCAFYVDHFHGEILTTFAWEADNTALSQRLGLDRSAGKLAMLGFGATRLEVFEFAEPHLDRGAPRSVAKPGFSHIAFEVDDAEAEYARLAPVMRFHAPPLMMPSGGVFAYGRDPDGNVVEVIQPPKPVMT